MIKFRKMRRGASSDPVTLRNDERFTRIGGFLAATRFDELPQFINVLRGEMRLVGPRPELECFVAQYASEYTEILTVTPGITGNAQLQFVDENRLLSGPSPAARYVDHVLPAKIKIDLDYVRRHTLRADLLILARTAALPLVLVSKRCRNRSGQIRLWVSSLAVAVALAVGLIVLSSGLP